MFSRVFDPSQRARGLCALVALTGALAAGAVPGAASAISVVGTCPPPASYLSHVSDQVVSNGNGTWTYNFTVYNDGASSAGCVPLIVDWELPYFPLAGITNITSPQRGYGGSWSSEIKTGTAQWQDPNDPMYQGPNSPFTTATQVLHWYIPGNWATGGIGPGTSLSGFSFVANYGPASAPYSASWDDILFRTGDPSAPLVGLPNSPELQVPEPATLGLFSLGLAGLLTAGMRRRRGIAG